MGRPKKRGNLTSSQYIRARKLQWRKEQLALLESRGINTTSIVWSRYEAKYRKMQQTKRQKAIEKNKKLEEKRRKRNEMLAVIRKRKEEREAKLRRKERRREYKKLKDDYFQ